MKNKASAKSRSLRKLLFNRRMMALPYGIFMIVFVVVPLVLVLLYSFMQRDTQGQLTWNFTFDNYVNAFNSVNMQVLGRSVWVGLATTLLCFAIGYPTAYILANKKYNRSSTLVLLFVVPMWMNFLLRTLATKAMFLSLDTEFGYFTLLFGMVYNFLPFMILPIYTTLTKIDGSLSEAAADLGANDRKIFLKVKLPLSLPGIISGLTMVFTPVITTFVISELLSNNKILLIGNVINTYVRRAADFNTASALSMVILLFIAATMLLTNKFDKDGAASGGMVW